jgi:hypothetical protein
VEPLGKYLNDEGSTLMNGITCLQKSLQRFAFVNITTWTIRKVFSCYEAYDAQGDKYKFSKILNFAWKIAPYHWQQKYQLLSIH